MAPSLMPMAPALPALMIAKIVLMLLPALPVHLDFTTIQPASAAQQLVLVGSIVAQLLRLSLVIQLVDFH